MHFKIFDKAISGYQKQIGLYDREQWECMIEERQLKNFRRIRKLPSKKVGTLVNLVDVDDVRTSFHSHQVQHSWTALTLQGLIRTLLFPFYLSWWRSQVAGLSWWLLVLYFTQILSTVSFLYYSDLVEQLTFSEALFPLMLMLVLGVLQHHISFTDNAQRVHNQTGRRQQQRQSDHSEHMVWHDDDVQLPSNENQQQQEVNKPPVLIKQSTPPPKMKSSTSVPVVRLSNSSSTGSPNRVEFSFANTEEPLKLNCRRNVLQDQTNQQETVANDNSSGDDDNRHNSRRGSVTGGDSRGESDNETGDDNNSDVMGHSLPLSVQKPPVPIFQYKNGDDDSASQPVDGLTQDCLMESLPEMLGQGVKKEAIVGCILTPDQFDISSKQLPLSSSSSSADHPATKKVNGGLADDAHCRLSQADDSAFSETSCVKSPSVQVTELKQPTLGLPAGTCLISRKPSSTSSSSDGTNKNNNANEPSSIDRVCEWRRTASLSSGAGSTPNSNSAPNLLPGSGVLRRRKFSGKEKSADRTIEQIVSVANIVSEPPIVTRVVDPVTPVTAPLESGNSSPASFKPILRNRCPPRKSSFTEHPPSRSCGGAISPTSSIDSSNKRPHANGVVGGGSSSRTPASANSRRRGGGTMTDDTEWDMHTEYPSDSMSSSESEVSDSERAKSGAEPAAADSTAQQQPTLAAAVPPCQTISQPTLVVETNVPATVGGLNPSTSTDSVPFPQDYPGNIGSTYMSQSTNKIGCLFWDSEGCKKVEMAMTDLGRILIDRVQRSVPPGSEYAYASACFAVIVAVVPLLLRTYQLCQPVVVSCFATEEPIRALITSIISANITSTGITLFSSQRWETILILNGIWQRFWLSLVFFFLLCVAENTFKQRVSYAKHFSYLTSAHRARRCDLPHFRLNKVRNIKTWLTLRAYIKRLGPQRPVDIIVSFSFILSVMLLSLLTFLILRDSSTFMTDSIHWELAFWLFVLAIFLLRFMTLGTKINRKYRSLSILITEQINLYVQMEEKPEKKESLLNANSALKLAEELIKELESPFKISGLAANPILYNISKVVLLSAFSAVATELLGFKLKLYKIKIPSA